MKLWLVTISYEVIATGETSGFAISNAADGIREDYDSNYGDSDATEVVSVSQVPGPWREAIPYGAEDDKTISQILKERA